ncbi:MAG: 2-oxo-4-hydroxy-4-carboxy-5-ureidoimidazoline decarboxylase, partial [Alphaproteobacteria bacterium]
MSDTVLSIDAVNALGAEAFVDDFGDIAEHAPWVAAEAAGDRPFDDRDEMIAVFADVIREASREAQRALLIAHPDLAGRAAVAGDVTEDSAREQAGAGLDRLTVEEYARFADLNDRYRARFGIPFISAVRGATKYQILTSYEQRIVNDGEDEFETAIEQVIRIVRFRLEDRV